MKKFKEVWDTDFISNQVNAHDLARLMIACMCNLTGSRAITDPSVSPNARLSIQLMPFAETALQLQRTYHKNPDYVLAILGNGESGVPMNAIVYDTLGDIKFDPMCSRLVSHTQETFLYRNPTADAGRYTPQYMRELARVSLLDGVKYLRAEGYWKDNSWGYDQDFARGSNYL